MFRYKYILFTLYIYIQKRKEQEILKAAKLIQSRKVREINLDCDPYEIEYSKQKKRKYRRKN